MTAMLDRVYQGVSVRALAREVATQRGRGDVVLAEQAWRTMRNALPVDISDALIESLVDQAAKETPATESDAARHARAVESVRARRFNASGKLV